MITRIITAPTVMIFDCCDLGRCKDKAEVSLTFYVRVAVTRLLAQSIDLEALTCATIMTAKHRCEAQQRKDQI